MSVHYCANGNGTLYPKQRSYSNLVAMLEDAVVSCGDDLLYRFLDFSSGGKELLPSLHSLQQHLNLCHEVFESFNVLVTDVLSFSSTNHLLDFWNIPEGLSNESLAFLQYTSGSTSDPKGVMLTHGNLLHNLHFIETCFGHTKNSHGMIWLPPYHDMGLIGGLLQVLYAQFSCPLMSLHSLLLVPEMMKKETRKSIHM
ncbi:hypothetical protein FDP41_009773 [Naegleria fowleri]|uniref:AMP-dependent synthetase/ligase domain-containing protein n=1 Tax=Naegleria fowleri TaxID=5763 RepID=A0A6A5B0J9_NAEFO|nr:uncharacterized protein FDP41_009773 [Naegleria fowleri]KAF0972077.1 hypothetical protein FDP41_009773 [Naegleria fowleri]